MEKSGEGVRKGAWAEEEDVLLKNCIEKYGEGKWHQVPLRAGLNRCRKSCRLRWLNYLRPNLKRGFFTNDEVDLIIRLHKLLGNRWTLIAGRLPGRTANDVKNFWNTHVAKKSAAAGESRRGKTTQKTITKNNIVRPRPRTFSELQGTLCPTEVTKTNEQNDDIINKQPSSSSSLPQEEPYNWTSGAEIPMDNQPFSFLQDEVDECIRWWSNLLEITENGEGATP